MKEILRKPKGITLIALVVTIIVLLILAGVSIQAVIGDNGIVTKASNAKENTAIAKEIEQIDISYADCQAKNMSEYQDEVYVTATQLETSMNKTYGEGTVEVTGIPSRLNVKYLETKREYIIGKNKKAQAKVDFEKLFEIAQKHPDQTGSNDIGIAEDGSIVNLDLWSYVAIEDGYWLVTEYSCYVGDGYIGDYIDGKIIGQVPMYIKEENGEFSPVTSMEKTFYEHQDIIIAPEIPSTVKYMDETFNRCRNLKTVPEIPDSVISMRGTFYECANLEIIERMSESVSNWERTFFGCSSLEKIPNMGGNVVSLEGTFHGCSSLKKIPIMPDTITAMSVTFADCTSLTEIPNLPRNLVDMSSTFSGCKSLTTVPEIPNTVTDMSGTFFDCVNLAGTLYVNADSLSEYSNCFYRTSTNPGCNLILTGTSPDLTNLLNTKSSNSNITIQ